MQRLGVCTASARGDPRKRHVNAQTRRSRGDPSGARSPEPEGPPHGDCTPRCEGPRFGGLGGHPETSLQHVHVSQTGLELAGGPRAGDSQHGVEGGLQDDHKAVDTGLPGPGGEKGPRASSEHRPASEVRKANLQNSATTGCQPGPKTCRDTSPNKAAPHDQSVPILRARGPARSHRKETPPHGRRTGQRAPNTGGDLARGLSLQAGQSLPKGDAFCVVPA